MTPLYGHAVKLHELEPHYSRHVSAMTSEGLHSKSDIAEELAWRDRELEASEARLLNVCMRFGVIEAELVAARAEIAEWREAAIAATTSPRNVMSLDHAWALERLAELVRKASSGAGASP